MSTEAIAPIDDILRVVERKFGKKIVVTSSIRTPLSQAKAMLHHFETNSDTLRSYASYKKPLLDEISKAYETGKKSNEFKNEIVDRMTRVIEKQVSQNKYISNHLLNSARDIRTKNFSSEELSKLISILRAIREIVVLDETGTEEKHIHIHLK